MEKNELIYLVHKAQAGDKGAFETLYSEYRDKVYFFVRRFAGSGDTAEDLTSAAFTVAMERIGELKSGESFVGWLYSIAYKKCVDFLRDESRTVKVSSAAELEELLEAAALNEPILLPEDYAVNAETRAQLKEVIDSLSPDQRSAVIMYYYDEMSIPEVAAAMGTNENNVSQKLHRARKRIRSKIEKLIGRGTLFGAVPMGTLLENLSDSGMNMSSGIGIATISAAAVAVPYGLNKVSGGVANELLFITRKYWARHKKSLAALLFSGVLLCAVVCCAFLMLRSSLNRSLHSAYDNDGEYDVAMPNASEEFISSVSDADTLLGTVTVYGSMEINGQKFEYGSLDDPHGLAHIPLDSGRLPENEKEAAVDKGVLRLIGYAGKSGDHIILAGKEYILCGIISENYGTQRMTVLSNDNSEETPITYPFPLIYTYKTEEPPEYTFTMLNNVCIGTDELNAKIDLELGDAFGISVNDKISASEYLSRFYTQKEILIYLLSGIAVVIAVLSVIAVARNIFAEREASMQMLRRIGVSNRQLGCMYVIECLLTAVIQTVIGIAVGIGAYNLIFVFETKALELAPYSGMTLDSLVTDYTVNPYFASALFSFSVLPVGYAVSAILSGINNKKGRSRKTSSLYRCISKAFRQRAVSVIQAVSLSLICFAAVLGYALYTENGKDRMEGTTYAPVVNSGFGNGFSFEEDDLEEYFCAVSPSSFSFGNLNIAQRSQISSGTDDSTADKLGAVSTGLLNNTFIIGTGEDNYRNSISLGTKEEKEYLISQSSENARSFLNEDHTLYGIQTKLADSQTIENLSKYIISGSINTDKLMNGKEVVIVLSSDSDAFRAGNKLRVGSAVGSGFGIESISQTEVTIGAVIKLPKDVKRVLKYAVSVDDCSLLTTVSGAKAMGFEGAAYYEVFSDHHIDGSLIPMSANMEMLSYSQQKKDVLINKLMQYGTVVLIMILMSLLGFAAYFNGIGMKIRLKEYQISLMRAVGTPLKKLRRRLMLDSIRIPLFAAVFSFGGIKLIQQLTYNAYNKGLELEKLLMQIPEGVDSPEQIMNYQQGITRQINSLNDTYFIDREPWVVSMIVPVIIVFAVMCIVTILLTRKSFRMFTPDIAGALARGRKRR